MVYTYTPAYYSSFQDTIASLCKSILLPFSLKNRRLPADQKLAKRQTDNLKWQQDSFHRILNLIGLHKEGIVPETEVSAFRSHLLDTLIASPKEPDAVGVVRDKLLFLQELLYAKCISADEYHSSKRPLLQRLAVHGAELDCKDVIIGDLTSAAAAQEEQWSVIDLRDRESPAAAVKAKQHRTPIKSLINWRGGGKDKKEPHKNAANNGTTSEAAAAAAPKPDKSKRKPFRSLFDKEHKDEDASAAHNKKKQWGFDGLKKWKRAGSEEDECAAVRSDDADSSSAVCALVASPIGEGPDTKRIKKKLHSDGSSSDFFIDKVLGDNIKKELARIQSELSATHPNLNFSDDQMDAISTRLPVDKADLKNFFPKSWCDRYGDIVLDVVKREFKDHVGELESRRNIAREKNKGGSQRWVAFEENEENLHPNYVFLRDHPVMNQGVNNPFIDDPNPFCVSKY